MTVSSGITGTGTIMRGREPADTAASTARTATTEGTAAGSTVVTVPVAVRATGPAAAAVRARGTRRDRGEGGGRSGGRGWVGSFVRFVVCGGGVSLLSSAVLLAVSGAVPFALANAVVTVASTLLSTELHHRVTFAVRGTATGTGAAGTDAAGVGAAGRAGRAGWAGWRIHAKSALTLVVAYLFTTVAVLALGAVHPHAGPLLTQAVYLSASGLAGTGRFLVLRLVVFARGPRRPAARELHRGTVTVAA
jgi:hypothetical protein